MARKTPAKPHRQSCKKSPYKKRLSRKKSLCRPSRCRSSPHYYGHMPPKRRCPSEPDDPKDKRAKVDAAADSFQHFFIHDMCFFRGAVGCEGPGKPDLVCAALLPSTLNVPFTLRELTCALLLQNGSVLQTIEKIKTKRAMCTERGKRIADGMQRVAIQRIFAQKEQAIVELLSNAVDSTLQHYGPAGRPKVGRFGMGFFSILAWVFKNENRHLLINTKTETCHTCLVLYYTAARGMCGVFIDPVNKDRRCGTTISLVCAAGAEFSEEELRFFQREACRLVAVRGVRLFLYSTVSFPSVVFNPRKIIADAHTEEDDTFVINNIIQHEPNTPVVHCHLGPQGIQVEDWGVGMAPDIILTTLLVPTVSSKGMAAVAAKAGAVQAQKSLDFTQEYEFHHPHYARIGIMVAGIIVTSIGSRVYNKCFLLDLPVTTAITVARNDVIFEDSVVLRQQLYQGMFKSESITKLLLQYAMTTYSPVNARIIYSVYDALLKTQRRYTFQGDFGLAVYDMAAVPIDGTTCRVRPTAVVDSEAVQKTLDDMARAGVLSLRKDIFNDVTVVCVPPKNQPQRGLPSSGGLPNMLFVNYKNEDLTFNILSQIRLGCCDLALTFIGEASNLGRLSTLEFCRDSLEKVITQRHHTMYWTVSEPVDYLSPGQHLHVLQNLYLYLANTVQSTVYWADYGPLFTTLTPWTQQKLMDFLDVVGATKFDEWSNVGITYKDQEEFTSTIMPLSLFLIEALLPVSQLSLFETVVQAFITISVCSTIFKKDIVDFEKESVWRAVIPGLKEVCLLFARLFKQPTMITTGGKVTLQPWENFQKEVHFISHLEAVLVSRVLGIDYPQAAAPPQITPLQTVLQKPSGQVVDTPGGNFTTVRHIILHQMWSNDTGEEYTPQDILQNSKRYAAAIGQRMPLQALEMIVNEGTTKPFLTSVVAELLQNSLDALKDHGIINSTIQIRLEHAHDNPNESIFSVRDVVGMSDETLLTLLTPFRSSKSDNPALAGEMGTGFFNMFRESTQVDIYTYYPALGPQEAHPLTKPNSFFSPFESTTCWALTNHRYAVVDKTQHIRVKNIDDQHLVADPWQPQWDDHPVQWQKDYELILTPTYVILLLFAPYESGKKVLLPILIYTHAGEFIGRLQYSSNLKFWMEELYQDFKKSFTATDHSFVDQLCLLQGFFTIVKNRVLFTEFIPEGVGNSSGEFGTVILTTLLKKTPVFVVIYADKVEIYNLGKNFLQKFQVLLVPKYNYFFRIRNPFTQFPRWLTKTGQLVALQAFEYLTETPVPAQWNLQDKSIHLITAHHIFYADQEQAAIKKDHATYTLRALTIATGKVLTLFRSIPLPFCQVSPNGNVLAIYINEQLYMYDTATCVSLWRPRPPEVVGPVKVVTCVPMRDAETNRINDVSVKMGETAGYMGTTIVLRIPKHPSLLLADLFFIFNQGYKYIDPNLAAITFNDVVINTAALSYTEQHRYFNVRACRGPSYVMAANMPQMPLTTFLKDVLQFLPNTRLESVFWALNIVVELHSDIFEPTQSRETIAMAPGFDGKLISQAVWRTAVAALDEDRKFHRHCFLIEHHEVTQISIASYVDPEWGSDDETKTFLYCPYPTQTLSTGASVDLTLFAVLLNLEQQHDLQTKQHGTPVPPPLFTKFERQNDIVVPLELKRLANIYFRSKGKAQPARPPTSVAAAQASEVLSMELNISNWERWPIVDLKPYAVLDCFVQAWTEAAKLTTHHPAYLKPEAIIHLRILEVDHPDAFTAYYRHKKTIVLSLAQFQMKPAIIQQECDNLRQLAKKEKEWSIMNISTVAPVCYATLLNAFSSEQMGAILLHELEHARRDSDCVQDKHQHLWITLDQRGEQHYSFGQAVQTTHQQMCGELYFRWQQLINKL